MSSICDRLREMADLFEAQQAPPNFVLHLRVGADEITRLTARVAQLEAALKPLACTCAAESQDECSRSEKHCPFWIARAALTQPAQKNPND
jgi:hypothetical protein